MPDLKKITLPNGTTYDLRDSRVDSIISQGTRWIGVTTTEIYDGSTTSTITINGTAHQAETGDIAGYQPTGKQQEEFIWSGSVWQEFGSTGSLKALAFKDSVAVTTQVPATFSTTFTGKQKSVSVTGTTTGSVSAPTISVDSAGATGTVKEPSFSVSNETLTIALSDKTFKTGDASYTASQPEFTGASMTSTGNYTPEATSVATTVASSSNVSGTVTYSPA